MGIMKDAVVGKVRGKLGNVVIYEVNGQVRVRMTPGSYKDRKSPAQLEHRAKVKGIAELYDKLDLQLVKYWKELTRGTTMNGYNLFMSRNIGNMTGEGKVADVAKVVLCQGDLEVPAWVKAEEKEEGVLEVTWEKHSEGRYEWGDYLQMVAYGYCEEAEGEVYWVDEFHGATRQDGRAEWRIPVEVTGPVEVYGFFKGKYAEGVSESFYLGRFRSEEKGEEKEDEAVAEEGA